MAVSTKRFSLTTTAYTDVSEGYESCAIRLIFRSNRSNNIQVHLGTSLPSASTEDFDSYRAPENIEDEAVISFSELASTDRVYLKAVNSNFSILVYRR